MRKLLSVAALLGSLGTIVCCFLPAVFVTLGFGAAFAGLVGAFPQLVWVSEHKALVFGAGGFLIAFSAFLQWRGRRMACPTDPTLAEGCRTARDWSRVIFISSVALYALGSFFAFAAPYLIR